MKKWHRIGICLLLTVCLFVLPACKKSQSATETTGTVATVPATNPTVGTMPTIPSTDNTPTTPPADDPEETIPAEIAYYQTLYPQCADLSFENGLEISIWHRASGKGAGYYCDFLPDREEPYTLDEAYELDQSAVPMEDMRKIVGYYIDTGAITKEQVTLKCVDMPSFSVNDRKPSYIQGLVDYYFWADEAIFKYVNVQNWKILDLATFDIDGDGAMEQIALLPGRWSSSMNIELMVAKNGVAECWTEFRYSVEQNQWWDITLEETNWGTVELVVTVSQRVDRQSDYIPTGEVYRFDLAVTDGNIVLVIRPGDTVPHITRSNGGVDAIPWPKQ